MFRLEDCSKLFIKNGVPVGQFGIGAKVPLLPVTRGHHSASPGLLVPKIRGRQRSGTILPFGSKTGARWGHKVSKIHPLDDNPRSISVHFALDRPGASGNLWQLTLTFTAPI